MFVALRVLPACDGSFCTERTIVESFSILLSVIRTDASLC